MAELYIYIKASLIGSSINTKFTHKDFESQPVGLQWKSFEKLQGIPSVTVQSVSKFVSIMLFKTRLSDSFYVKKKKINSKQCYITY